MTRKTWTAEELAAYNARPDIGNTPKSAAGLTHGDGGADTPAAGDACTTADGRSGYILAGGDGLTCVASEQQ